MLESLAHLYPFLILAGMSMAGVLLLLRRQARDREKVALDLIHLNESLGFDIFRFLETGAQRLVAAGFQGLTWEIEWFGSIRRGAAGSGNTRQGKIWERQIAAPDITLKVQFLSGRLTGERRFFAEFLGETFVLLLKMDIWIKAGGVASALSEFHRLTLFLGHDVKNLAQFIQIVGDQSENLSPDNEKPFLAYLRTALPLFRERSERIIKALANDRKDGEPADQDLLPALEGVCTACGVTAEITGKGMVRLPPECLDGILDNLLGNHAQHAPQFPLDIDISVDGSWVKTVITSGPAVDIDLLHLFEPFRTGSDNGLGLGLYQARQLARASGGNLCASLGQDNRLRFELTLPAARR